MNMVRLIEKLMIFTKI